MQADRFSGVCAVLLVLSGCQCCSITERYQNVIDHVADRSPHADHWYCAGWDVSRIGDPDWYECRWNQRWVDPSRVRGYRAIPDYAHNPIYIPSFESTEFRPIPEMPPGVPGVDPGTEDPGAPVRPGSQLRPIPDSPQLERGQVLPTLPLERPIPSAPVPEPPPALPLF